MEKNTSILGVEMNNSVFLANDYLELLQHAQNAFSNQCFLQNSKNKVTYAQYIHYVQSVAAKMKDISQSIVICDVKNPILFAIGYFSVIMSGHVCCLLPENHKIPDDLNDAFYLNDEFIDEALDTPPLPFEQFCPMMVDSPCTIAFSSGTSSTAKGILLSQRNLLFDTQRGMMRHKYWKGERFVHILPYWHLFGLVTELLAPLHAGMHLFIPASTEYIFQALKEFRPHSLHIPPAVADTICTAIEVVKSTEAVTGGCLKNVMCAGAPLSNKTTKSLIAYDIYPCIAYGLTECSPCVSMMGDDDLRIGSVGKPLKDVLVKISEDGEILVRGEMVMLGYYNDEMEKYKNIQDGFLHTGDRGFIDEDGYLYVIGRFSNMLVFKNGKKIIPEKVETQINQLPQVRESLISISNDIPKLTIVTSAKLEMLQGTVEDIMKREGLEGFIICIQTEPLKKNFMGKVVRE